MKAWSTRAIQTLVNAVPKAKPPSSNSEVWNLNLDQIESHGGRVLEKVYVSTEKLGPSTFAFEPRTVLYSKLRPYLNKVVVANEAGFATTELVPLRCNLEDVHPEYLAYFLRSEEFLKFATAVVAGAKMPRMVMSEFWNFQVPLPPLPEQRRIAAILDQADALRAKRREALAQLDSLTQSIFIEMFVGKKDVPMTTFGEVARLKRGPFGGALKKEIFVDAGPMVYEQRNAIYDDCMTGRYFISESKFSEMEDFSVKPDDLIVSCSGTLGKVAVVPNDAPKGIINQALLLVRVDKKKVTPTFVKYVLGSDGVQRKLSSVSHGTGLQNFPPMSEVKALEFPIPNISLQRQFAERIQTVTNHKGLAISSAMALDSLFSSIQHRAFKGEL